MFETELSQFCRNVAEQAKKASRQLQRMRSEITNLRQDLDDAAQKDNEALGVKILSRLDEFGREEQILKQHVDQLIAEIAKVRTQRQQLHSKLGRLDSKMASLKLREEILKVRKQFTQQSQAVMTSTTQLMESTEPLEEEFERLEAQIESLEPEQDQMGDEIATIRQRRSQSDLQRRFAEIRNQTHGRRLLLDGCRVRGPLPATAR